MTSEALSFDPRELLAHSTWVRALASSLLSDGPAADDVAQETWLAALQRPPREAAALRPWLGAVVRNLARLRLRGDERRTRRERAAARPERLPSTAELIEHEAERKRLVDCVLALPAPYRTTVLLRFWSELAPEEIARRFGIPASTVRNRLKRALDRIRAELDQDGRARGTLRCILAFPPASPWLAPAPGVPATLGVVTLMTQTKLLAALLVIVAAAVGWVLFQPRSEMRQAAAPPGAARAEPATPAPPPAKLAVRSEEPVPPPPPPPSTAAPAPTFEVGGSVRDEIGDPVEGVLVCFVDPDGEPRFAKTSAAGSYAIGGVHEGAWTVHCSKPGFLETRAPVQPTADEDRYDWVLHPTPPPLPVRFLTDADEPLRKTWSKSGASGLGFDLAAVATAESPSARIDLIDPSEHYRCGSFRLGGAGVPAGYDGLLEFDAPLPLFVSAVLRDVVLETRWVERDVKELTFRLPSAGLLARGATIEFDVTDAADGHRLDAVRVSTSTLHCVQIGGGRQSNGHVVLANEPFGQRGLWVRAAGYAPFYSDLDVQPGEHLDLGTIALVPAVPIRGRVVGRDGATPECWIHEWDLDRPADQREASTQIVFGETQKDGSFRLDAPPGRRLLIARPKQGYGWAAVAVDARKGAVSDVEIVVEPAVAVTIAPDLSSPALLRIRDATGLPLWSEWVTGSTYALDLASGRYTFEMLRGGRKLRSVPLDVGGGPCLVPVFDPPAAPN